MDALLWLLLMIVAPVAVILLIIWMHANDLMLDLLELAEGCGATRRAIHLGESFAADLRAVDPYASDRLDDSSYERTADGIIARVVERPRVTDKDLRVIIQEEGQAQGYDLRPLGLRRIVRYLRRRIDDGLLL